MDTECSVSGLRRRRGRCRLDPGLDHYFMIKTNKSEGCPNSRLNVLILLLVFGISVFFMPAVIQLARRLLSNMATNPGAYSMAFITVPKLEDGKRLAREMLDQKLVACVNIIPGIVSMYEWEGKIKEDGEFLMMLKTRTDKIDDISAYIRKNHPYDVAEVISTPITNGNQMYLDWLGKVVPK